MNSKNTVHEIVVGLYSLWMLAFMNQTMLIIYENAD
jgi:hypothetical protein